MSNILNSDFPLPSNAYLAFDGLTIKEKIKERLLQTGIFTDQNFEGSNLSALNDVIAMVFSLLIYNLNRTANEGQFSNAQIYENMNRIVKQLDYKPIGYQTASLAFTMSAQNIAAGVYTIPRYTSLNVNGINYTFSKDTSFSKTTNNTIEEISNVGNNELLYQGTFIEFPTYTASGNNNELLYLTVNDTIVVDNFNIFVYIKSTDGKWTIWNKTQSLYLHNANDNVYELRFNENKKYEIKFGNGINGKKLSTNDLIAIYYLKSDGTKGEVSAGSLNGAKVIAFNSVKFNEILNDTIITNTNYLNNNNGLQYLVFNNSCVSSSFDEPETTEQIRTNAPGLFRSQYSLTTQNSYETFIKTNFSNIIQDAKVKNNSEFMNSYVKYFYDLGLTRPQLESRALFNQMKMGDACNFNNVYIFVVPKTINNNLGFVYPAQKQLILDSIQEQKTLTSEIIISDPVYLTLDIALSESNVTEINDIDQTEIYIEPYATSKRNSASIINDVNYIITNYFNRQNLYLGQTIDINDLTNQILGIAGIKKIYTRRMDTGYMVDGLRFLMWNPVYGDISTTTVVGNITLDDFQFPYLFTSDLTNKISVNDTFSKFEKIVI